MSELESKKLSNEEMEEVTGGTTRETREIIEALYDSGTIPRGVVLNKEKVVQILKNNHIQADLSAKGKNEYYDKKEGFDLSQRALIRRIYNGQILW